MPAADWPDGAPRRVANSSPLVSAGGDRTSTYEGDQPEDEGQRWARLCIVHPRDMATELAVELGRTTLGRSEDAADIAIAHRTISRTHLELRREGASLVALDLGSRNGSWINDVPVGQIPRPLTDGDVVRMGEVVAVVEMGDADGPDPDDAPSEAVPGRSVAAQRLRRKITRAAADPSPVLLIGDSGTGKESVARQLHEKSRRPGPWIVTNCAALTATLIDSQLFGHVKGAFTGAVSAQPGLFRAADGGTLFLDEVGEIPLEVQPKLLRAVELGEVAPLGEHQTYHVDTRIIAATNRDLAAAVEEGGFRRDLYARLSLFEIRIPSLRSRRADVLMWLQRLYDRWWKTREQPRVELELSAEAAATIVSHPWPENLRGLDHLVHELATRTDDGTVTRAKLPAWLTRPPASDAGAGADRPTPATPPESRPDKPDRNGLLEALEAHAYNIAAVAAHFGRDRKQIYRWVESFDIELKR